MTSERPIGIWGGMILLLGLILLLSARGHAAPIFTKVADTSTVMPGEPTRIFTYVGAPSISQGEVAFYGDSGANYSGIYSTVGGSIDVIADEDTGMQYPPDTSVEFRSFGNSPAISEGAVSFSGSSSSSNGITGVYHAFEEQGSMELFRMVDQRFLSGAYDYFGNPSASGGPGATGGSMAFRARHISAGRDALFLDQWHGTWTVANQSTAIPGGTGTFETFYNPSHSGDEVVFWGRRGTEDGIYLFTLSPTGGSLDVVADESTPIPGGTGNFSGFAVGHGGQPGISEGNIAFFGTGINHSGIYSVLGGDLDVVADQNTLIPGSTETFRYFNNGPAISGERIAFSASDAASNSGIYLWSDGELDVLIDETYTLDGKSIDSLWLGREGLDGLDIAFQVYFTDGSYGIYTASPIPEPGTALLLAVGLAGLAATGRRRSRHQWPGFE